MPIENVDVPANHTLVTIFVPNNQVPLLLDAFSEPFGFPERNPEELTKAQFAKKYLLLLIKRHVVNFKRRKDEQAVPNDPFNVS
jgi:hypothetical protein